MAVRSLFAWIVLVLLVFSLLLYGSNGAHGAAVVDVRTTARAAGVSWRNFTAAMQAARPHLIAAAAARFASISAW